VEPEVWEVLGRVKSILADRDTEVLAEVHEHYTMQKRLAEHGLWVYDFALPMLTLQVRPLCSLEPLCSKNGNKDISLDRQTAGVNACNTPKHYFLCSDDETLMHNVRQLCWHFWRGRCECVDVCFWAAVLALSLQTCTRCVV
jgi:hypothetical protein